MFLTRSEYDRGVNTFSPEGRLFQVEYAMEAIKLGSTAIGICTKEGVVLGVEKRIKSPLIINKAVDKIFEVDYHIGCAVSGLMADARTIVERARVECANHWFNFNERMSVESVAQATSNFSIQFGGDGDAEMAISRPFGVGIMFAGYDENGPQLYHLDPSGTFIRFDAKAVGAGGEGATQTLQERYNKSMTLSEAVRLILLILKQVMEEKLSVENVEIATVTKGDLFKMVPKEDLVKDLEAIEGVEL
ncbi:Proteasome subunit beta type-9 [Nesidiocoris tenuis]|uniref:Proteasome subunit alpha type n=1 Tax=Nesidiocoris tenuis TaxID=355587 RepID=A0ABN7AVX3_9HEMI|nr:Proteasome subunit beta type-9 [Nesidiocoris tenuis]